MRHRKLAGLLVLVAVVVACATAETDAYKVLGSTTVAVDTAMRTYGALVAAGKVSAATQATVYKAYSDYQTAMLAAQVAINSWKAASGTTATFPTAQVNVAVAAGSAVQTATVKP